MLQLIPPLFWAGGRGFWGEEEETHNRSAAEPECGGDGQRQIAEHSVLNNEANERGWTRIREEVINRKSAEMRWLCGIELESPTSEVF